MKPYFVKEIRDNQGKLVQENKGEVIRPAVSSKTATHVSQLLRSVVVNGNGNRAEIEGYYVTGKTGTAEVPHRGAYGDERIASFVGFAPVDNPVLATLVVLYNPKVESAYGGVLAAPLFGEIMEESLEYLGVKRRKIKEPRSPLVIVPNVSNYSLTEAQRRLNQHNLQWATEGTGDLVVDQTPRPGTRVPAQATVHLYFRNQESREEIVVPSVTGMSMRDASLKLAESGLKISISGSGTAYEQYPSAGTIVPEGATVTVKFKI